MGDAEIRAIIYLSKERENPNRAEIDRVYVAEQMNKRNVAMTLLWNEYCDKALHANRDPLMHAAFESGSMRIEQQCALSIRSWSKFRLTGWRHDASMRFRYLRNFEGVSLYCMPSVLIIFIRYSKISVTNPCL